MSASSGRQLELLERPHRNALLLFKNFYEPAAESPFTPEPFDHRFRHRSWQAPPLAIWQQGFLAAQDW